MAHYNGGPVRTKSGTLPGGSGQSCHVAVPVKSEELVFPKREGFTVENAFNGNEDS